MAKQPNRQPNNSAASLSGRPQAFSHVKGVRPGFQQAASGSQEKKQVQTKASRVKKQFRKAHEGPREKLAKPKKQLIPTPKGNQVKEVHTQVELEKQTRNRLRDQQMKKWRERRIEPSHGARPKHELKKQTPDVHLKAEKKRQFQEMLQAKRAMRRGRGR